MGFATLQNLENRLSTLKSNLSNYKSQLDTQNKRRSKIESIIKDMRSVCSNRSDDINGHLNKMINNYDDAMRGGKVVTTLVSTTRKDKEFDVSIDDDMNNALSQLQSELNDVCRKIGELEGSIQVCKSQISACEADIRTERRNIALDFQRKYYDAQARVNSADAACKADPTSLRLKAEFNKACRERDTARYNYNQYKWWL